VASDKPFIDCDRRRVNLDVAQFHLDLFVFGSAAVVGDTEESQDRFCRDDAKPKL
jgi:hypothetical protein